MLKELLLLGVLFIIMCIEDYIEWKEEMRDMMEDEEEEEEDD